MGMIFDQIKRAIASEKKLLAVLVDPDKFNEDRTGDFIRKLPAEVFLLLVGGSTVDASQTDVTVRALKEKTKLPVVLFPGDVSQISLLADGILFLSLLSGRNPEYLIEQQIKAAPVLQKSCLEVIPTGYILLNGGKKSAVERVTGTRPIPQDRVDLITHTALAGEYSGKKMIYLEAGSGAEIPVLPEIIAGLKKVLSIPLIVGGGIRSREQLNRAYDAGADLVVIGTAFEENCFVEASI